ncbi:hypothetical protein C8R44DRAFT_808512 [Mycena epipterygia]|nr:hypothetical protein C8R44DRAFT_808512 [Mycena epipterygia]
MFHAQFSPMLHKLLLEQTAELQRELSSIIETFLASVIASFARRVMYQKVENRFPAPSIGCRCKDCRDIQYFFWDDRLFISLQRINTEIKHLNSVLDGKKQALPAGITVKTDYVNSGSSKLTIKKPENLTKHGFWSANSNLGKTLLYCLGNIEVQRRVLGDAFHSIQSRITEIEAVSGHPPKPRQEFQVSLNQLQDLLAESDREPATKKRRLR